MALCFDAFVFAEEHLSTWVSFAIAKVNQYKMQIHRAFQDLDEWLKDPDEFDVKIDDVHLTPGVIANDLERFHLVYPILVSMGDQVNLLSASCVRTISKNLISIQQ